MIVKESLEELNIVQKNLVGNQCLHLFMIS